MALNYPDQEYFIYSRTQRWAKALLMQLMPRTKGRSDGIVAAGDLREMN